MNIGLVYKSLVDEDFKVLSTLERLHTSREYISLGLIESNSGIHEGKLQLILSKLYNLSLIRGEIIGGVRRYRLTILGYDVLAMKSLVKNNFIEAVGDKIGVGKESEIYVALAPGGIQVAVKFLRIGKRSFRQTKRVRAWSRDRDLSWYSQSKIAAEREYDALIELTKHNASVPRPIGYNRHVVVVEYIDGVELYKRPRLEHPEKVLRDILETISIAFHKVGIVHGDLSEYNVLIRRSDEGAFIIDWPQYVYRDDTSAGRLLNRDVNYIVRFFKKIYGVSIDPLRALDMVLNNQI